MGEDPYLAARFTEAAVRGLQGSSTVRPGGVIAVLKHFCAQGAGAGGLNFGPALIGERELREIHLPPMQAGVNAGAHACIAAYNEIDGVPCSANPHLLKDILRDEWGFEGIVISDAGAIDRLEGLTGSLPSAAVLALESGVDVSLWNESLLYLENALANGDVAEVVLDKAVRRILRLKFALGLFDERPSSASSHAFAFGQHSARLTNLEMARQAVVLLKNDHRVLPLSTRGQKIAVVGPNGNSVYNQLGDYTPPQKAGETITVVQGLRERLGADSVVMFARGCGIRDQSTDGFAQALSIAEEADVIIAVVGGSSARNFGRKSEDDGDAELSVDPDDMDAGEGVDVADLALGGKQEALIQTLVNTGKPVVAVLIQGRPHAIPTVVDQCAAVVCAWYPGQQGGRAIAEILLGDVAPSGRLPVSIPRSSAQLPVYYNGKDTGSGGLNYRDQPRRPLYPFGFGLTYTNFSYGPVQIEPDEISCADLMDGRRIIGSSMIRNSGSRPGIAVAQLYVTREFSSVTHRVCELKGFQRLGLAAGQEARVRFELGKEDLAIWGTESRWTIEPSVLRIGIGPDSATQEVTRLTVRR